MDTNGVRRWRISGVLPFPKREAVEIPGETPDSLPKKIAFLSRVAPQRRAYGDIAVGLRPFPDNSLPPEMTAGWGPMREPVELSFVTEAVDAEASRAKVRDPVELV